MPDVRRLPIAALSAAVLAVLPHPALAHLVSARFGDFYGGMLHPLLSLESLLPWIALGFLAGMQDVRAGRWMLLAFPLAIALGAAGSLWDAGIDEPVTAANLLSFVLIGGLVVLGQPIPSAILLFLGALLGLAQGWENGLAINADTNVGLFITGVTVAGYIAVTLVTAATATLLRRTDWARIAVRAAGSWITAIGLLVVGVKLATT